MLSFLDRVVSEEGISTGPDKVKTVQDCIRVQYVRHTFVLFFCF
jgi:hypothetical protein